MKIAILTSSRADYGIYLPLLKALDKAEDVEWGLVVFGTHLSKMHGYTLTAIEEDGFPIVKKIDALLPGDTPKAIAHSYAVTAAKFADFWSEEGADFNLVFVLGDRFEMAAAVAAGIPFGIKFAHVHGGETTLGAIDNVYRHSISLASAVHFVSAEAFEQRLTQVLGDAEAPIYNVGSLSLENLDQLDLLDLPTFKEMWGIDLQIPTILVTVHPETVAFDQNEAYSTEIIQALQTLASTYQIVITMPNADTAGMIYRTGFANLAQQLPSVHTIENFGTQSYFTCMKYARLLIGNTSSGIVEAASFQKYVFNIGNRQKGRLCGENVIHLPFNAQLILQNAHKYVEMTYLGPNLYHQSQPSARILTHIRSFLGKL
jgi:GDP/UDP-N,N'-diacetylbacillosamine 2-epimerase (hydrolysing)